MRDPLRVLDAAASSVDSKSDPKEGTSPLKKSDTPPQRRTLFKKDSQLQLQYLT